MGVPLMGPDGGFIMGGDFLMDGAGRSPRPSKCYDPRHPGPSDMALLSVRDLSVAFETRDGVVRR